MAWRQIHDDIPSSKTLGRLSDAAERLYVRLLSQTDQWGRLTGDPDKLRIVAIPSLPWDDQKLYAALTELERAGAIDRYSTNGVWVTQIVNFDQRQAFNRQRRQDSRYPARTLESLSPSDLHLSLPLLAERPEACATDALPLPAGEPEACDLALSGRALRTDVNKKPLQPPDNTDRRREKREESYLPTAEARSAGEGLSIARASEDSHPPDPLAQLSFAEMAERAQARRGFADLPAGITPPRDDLAAVLAELSDRDDGTLVVLERLRSDGLPPAAFVSAMEALRERRVKPPPLKSDVRYVVSALKTMLREGRYRREGAAA